MLRPASTAMLLLLAAGSAYAQATTADGLDIEAGVRVPLRDGVKLHGIVYFPAGPRTPRPVVLAMTPYMIDRYHTYAIRIAKRGYVVALVDVRGRGGSEGHFMPFEQEAKDGYDTVEWLAKQPWSNGKIGMIGGSYGGFNQWSIAKEFPPHLVTITPTASAHMGIDFPMLGGIKYNYLMSWLTFTSGGNAGANLFGDAKFWNGKYRSAYTSHTPYARLDSVVGNATTNFQRFIGHPDYDQFWKDMSPSPEQLARLRIPIFTRTGMYDGDQVGAMEHYRNHMKHGTAEAKAKHYLMIGPWDHAGTRVPQKTFGGLSFGDASIVAMEELEADWFDWTMGNGPRPKQLPRRVAYYVTGAEEWKYADNLEEIGRNPTKYYLSSGGNGARSVFESGSLGTMEPRPSAPDEWTYDPLDTKPGLMEPADADYTSQFDAMNLNGGGLVYHTQPFAQATEISGFPMLSLWLTLDVPDSDIQVGIFEITPDGKSILLDDAMLRLRYRDSRSEPRLLTPGQPTQVNLDRFRFMSRRVGAGSRIRLVISSINSIQWEKNYNSGGVVAKESAKDARTARIKLLHEPGHWSSLELPVVRSLQP
jgi:putative CocE/NonD family hydrolase